MGKLQVFNFITLNGYYKGSKEDISWHKQNAGEDEQDFASEGAQSGSILLFGRTTYDMMSGFWPTEAAYQAMPKVADGMNKSEKIVFSKRLRKAHWNNTRIISKNITDQVLKLKHEGKIMTILGSGSIVSQFAEAGIIDEYQFLLDPVAIAKGTTLFKGIKNELHLQLVNSKVFRSGSILLCYAPRKNT